MNIAVIGAGPIGCYTGYLLAQKGHQVTIYENHPQVGAPIQCTGILTSSFDQFNLPKDAYLVNTIKKITVHAPHATTTIKQKDYIVCRTKFDQYLAFLAQKAGAQVLTNHSFTRKEGKSLIIKDTKNQKELKITPDIVIAADGPLSPTAKAYNMYYKQRKNYYGVQATVTGSFNEDEIITYFGTRVCPGLFAWITPESATTARVGLACQKNSKHYFDQFMLEHNFTPVAMQAGTIPFYEPKQILHKDNCYLVGDASTFVKATTLGGIVPAMQQAQILVDCIEHNKNYKKALLPLRREMWMHLRVQKVMQKLTNKDFDKLVTYVNQPKVQKVFEKYTRDNPIPLVLMTLLKEPRFLYFLKYLF